MEAKICPITKKKFTILDKEILVCKTFNVPLPTLHPQERLREIMATRNERNLYVRKCDSTGEQIISAYAPDSKFKIYKNSVWWGDSWDPLEYGKNFDFNKNFFQQFDELQTEVPREGTTIFNSENCEYNSHIRNSKDCYLSSLVANSEDCLYSYWLTDAKDSVDCVYANLSDLCYWCSDIDRCFNCTALRESVNCTDCYFSYQLRGCNNCIFCTNLANKNYYIFNNKCSKEEFEKLKNEIFNGSVKSWLDAKNKFEEIVKKAPKKYLRILKSENSIGDHIYNSKNCINCFDAHEIEDAYNSASLGDSKDVYSSYSVGWPRSELIYYSSVVRSSQKCAFCKYIWQSSDLFYCDSCISCKNCFGCIGLKHKEYCILNKQYSQEEYLHLIAKIIAHMKSTNEWGKFFPQSISPFSYNETAAYDFFPLSKEEAIARGYLWKEAEKKDISVQSSTNDILMCDSCKKNYKLIVQELKFYKKKGLPEPVNCPNCRHKERFGKRNKYEIYKTTCNKCNTQIFTTFPPANGNVVYCEKCYQEDIN